MKRARSDRQMSRSGGAGSDNSDHVYRVIEIVGTSKRSLSEAIEAGVARACKTLRNVRWFEVGRISGHVQNGKIAHYQVSMTVGFTMEEPA